MRWITKAWEIREIGYAMIEEFGLNWCNDAEHRHPHNYEGIFAGALVDDPPRARTRTVRKALGGP